MKKINKLALHKAKTLTFPEMKNISGGYDWGMQKCYVYFCSGGGQYFNCDRSLGMSTCYAYWEAKGDCCGIACFE